MICFPTLELPLLSVELALLEEDVGALARMLDRRLVASDVSPDFRSLSNEVRALLSGLDLWVWDLWVWVEFVAVE